MKHKLLQVAGVLTLLVGVAWFTGAPRPSTNAAILILVGSLIYAIGRVSGWLFEGKWS